MPEGDILVRVARRLDAALAGQTLVRGELRWPTLGGTDLAGSVVLGSTTHGKHLLTRLGDGRTLHTHLRMDGSWRVVRSAELAPSGRSHLDRSPWVRAVLATPLWTCLGLRLGTMDLVPTRDEPRLLGHLGPDVLAAELDLAEAVARLRAQGTRPVGEVLLDQTVLAGLGTIYMAESLWGMRLWPWTPAQNVPDAEGLVRRARDLMQRSVEARSPTATGDGRRTRAVHQREHCPCPRCGTAVTRGTVGRPPVDRPVYWCPTCQRPPSAP